jgi:hypothetical protein
MWWVAPRHRRRQARWVFRGAALALGLVVVSTGIAGCSSGGHRAAKPVSTSASGVNTHSGAAKPMCGFMPRVRPHKILVIWEENHSYGDVIGSPDAPTFNAVASACGSATHYEALTHPSLPNYLAMTSGVPFDRSPYTSDCDPTGSCVTSAESVFAQETAAGHSWKSYNETMPSNCHASNSGTYAVRHNPALYYPSLASQCATNDVPLGTTSSGALATDLRNGTLPTLSTVTPNVNNDMHDGTVAQADAWVDQWLPAIVQSKDYQSGNLVVLIAWDEGTGEGNHASAAPLLVLSPAITPGSKTDVPLNDYSVLRAIDEVRGLPPLGRAATVTSVTAPLGVS